MAYTVLARRYRSKTFDELIGQEAIARSLVGAVEKGRIAHAYLFCGTRGVGKTSAARLFAIAIAGNPEGGPDDPVNQAIMRGEDSDVIEIDAASNRGVDEARDLIANAAYRSLRAGRKVYIIDEVHMLTREAFNALLKTLEEPPEHVVFILCTTEPEKLLPTIRSRCQRYDFRPIPPDRIAEQIRRILEEEGVSADADLIASVARLGNGSMRDALSLLDRLLASGETHLTRALLEDLLGIPPREGLTALIEAIADRDAPSALARCHELVSQGLSIERICETLAQRLHDLLLLGTCGAKTGLVDLDPEARKQEAALAQRFDEAQLTHMLAVCEATQRRVRTSAVPQALMDAAIVRMACAHRFADAAAVIAGDAPQGAQAASQQRAAVPKR